MFQLETDYLRSGFYEVKNNFTSWKTIVQGISHFSRVLRIVLWVGNQFYELEVYWCKFTEGSSPDFASNIQRIELN